MMYHIGSWVVYDHLHYTYYVPTYYILIYTMALRSQSLNTFTFLFDAGTETDSIRNVFPKFIGRDQTGTWKRRRVPRSVHGEQRRQTSEFLLLLFRVSFFFPLILFIQSPSSVGVIPTTFSSNVVQPLPPMTRVSLINKLHRLLSTPHILKSLYSYVRGRPTFFGRFSMAQRSISLFLSPTVYYK